MTTPEITSVPPPRYVPILKGKAGELEALKLVHPRTRRAMLPLVEAVPKDDGDDQAANRTANRKACEQLTAKLAKNYDGPVMLDGGLFPDLAADVATGLGIVGTLAKLARDQDLVSQPVVRLGDPPRALDEAGWAHNEDQNGITIRLASDDIDEDPEDVDTQLEDLLEAVAATAADVDLVLDLGAIEGDVPVRGGARMVLSFVRDLASIQRWRSVTVASGGFPVDLSQFMPYVIGERARFDAHLYDQVHRRRVPRRLDYGDYATAHPELTIGPAFSPPPQLRYTTADHWMILKGRKNDPRGNAQFQHICKVIAAHADFTGTPTGAADERIARGSPEGPGNGTTWRTVGTTHHLDLVALRLTTMGEP